MSIESTLQPLAVSVQPKLVEAMLCAYEIGYRDALATRPSLFAAACARAHEPPESGELRLLIGTEAR